MKILGDEKVGEIKVEIKENEGVKGMGKKISEDSCGLSASIFAHHINHHIKSTGKNPENHQNKSNPE
jgi:hypothetical protein